MKKKLLLASTLLASNLGIISTAAATEVSEPAWLATTLDSKDTAVYARLPNVWSIFSPEDNIVSTAKNNPEHINQVTAIQQALMKNVISKINNPEIKLAATTSLHSLRAPIEIAVIKKGEAITDLSITLASKLQLSDIKQFDDLLNTLLQMTGDKVQIKQATDQNGSGSFVLANIANINYRYDLSSQKVVFAINYANQSPTDLNALIHDKNTHDFNTKLQQYDASGRGLLLWTSPKQFMSFSSIIGNSPELKMLKTSGLDQMNYAVISNATVNGKSRLQLKLDASTIKPDLNVPQYTHNIDIKSVGTPRYFMIMALPTQALLKSIYAEIPDENKPENAPYFELAFSGLASIDNNIQIISDDLGIFAKVSVKDTKKLADFLEQLQTKFPKKVQVEILTAPDGTEVGHLVIKNKFFFPKDNITSEPALYDSLTRLFTKEIFWIQEDDQLILAALPQNLLDRKASKKRTSVAKWLQNTQKTNFTHSVFAYAGNSRDLPRDSYYLYLNLISQLAFASDAKNTIINLPSSRDLKLPEYGYLNFKIDMGKEIGLSFNSDQGIFDVLTVVKRSLYNVVGISSVTSILAATAIPAYLNYTVRAKTTTALLTATPIKEKIEKAHADKVDLNKIDNESLQIKEDDYRNSLVDSIHVFEGTITINLSSDLISNYPNASISLMPQINDDNTKLTWICQSKDLPNKYLPAICR